MFPHNEQASKAVHGSRAEEAQRWTRAAVEALFEQPFNDLVHRAQTVHRLHFDATFALWRYEFPCDGLVQALKYRAQLALAGFFARSLASRPLPEVDVVLPMPLHAKRLAERGFNQALEIARGLARYRGTPIEPRGVLRVKNTPPQTELPYEDRAKNVRGAFRCELDLSGASVAVLDDVMTTGATLNELARVLKRAGARRVENFVIARTVLR